MIEELKELLKNAYAPYSDLKVAAIAITKDNQQHSGINIENASYGATICAERVAINNAISKGYKKGDFKELHIMTNNQPATPCFLCRQVIEEFFNKDTKIYVYSNKDKKEYTKEELCPYPFNKDDLK